MQELLPKLRKLFLHDVPGFRFRCGNRDTNITGLSRNTIGSVSASWTLGTLGAYECDKFLTCMVPRRAKSVHFLLVNVGKLGCGAFGCFLEFSEESAVRKS